MFSTTSSIRSCAPGRAVVTGPSPPARPSWRPPSRNASDLAAQHDVPVKLAGVGEGIDDIAFYDASDGTEHGWHGTYLEIDGRPAVRFERVYPHSVERVWRAVTDPAEMRHWFPSPEISYDARPGGTITLSERNEPSLIG